MAKLARGARFIGVRTQPNGIKVSDSFTEITFTSVADLLELGAMIEVGLGPYTLKDEEGEKWKVVLSGPQIVLMSPSHGVVRVGRRELLDALYQLQGNFLLPPA
jgi:hypothetical protein